MGADVINAKLCGVMTRWGNGTRLTGTNYHQTRSKSRFFDVLCWCCVAFHHLREYANALTAYGRTLFIGDYSTTNYY